MNIETAVKEYYQNIIGLDLELCLLVDYDSALLKILPQEIIEKGYDCGDPSVYLTLRGTVLDPLVVAEKYITGLHK